MPYEVDQPGEEQDVPYQVSRINGSCNGLERGGSLAKCLDASTQEDLGKPNHDHIVRKNGSDIISLYFDKHPVVTQPHILHGLIKHKKLKCATKLFGFQDAKSTKACVNAIENISKAFYKFGNQGNWMFDLLIRKLPLMPCNQVHRDNKWSQQCQNCSMFQEKYCTRILNLGFE